MGTRINELNGGAQLDLVRELLHPAGEARELIEDTTHVAGEFFRQADNLAEGYVARTGILLQRSLLQRTGGATQISTPGAVTLSSASGTDRRYDGFYVGADGRTYAPTTPLSRVPPVLPRNGRGTGETLIYINGISTTKNAQFSSLQDIADRTGACVIGIHNATQGGIVDVIQSTGDTLDIGSNPAVDTVAATVYNELHAGHNVHLLAHSQGALITSRALQDVRNRLLIEDGMSRGDAERLLSRVRVETFGGAAGYYPDGPQYVHYVNRFDPVAGLFGLGPVASPLPHPGRGAVIHRFTERHNSHGFEATYLPRRVPFEQARRGDFN